MFDFFVYRIARFGHAGASPAAKAAQFFQGMFGDGKPPQPTTMPQSAWFAVCNVQLLHWPN